MRRIIGFGLAVGLLCATSAQAQAVDPAKERAFLTQNAKAPGVQSMLGLQYKVLKSGPADGKHPTRTSAVRVRYEGRGIDGKVFDTSAGKGPADGSVVFILKMMIPGFQVPLLYMKPGDEWEVYVPAELAYSTGGSPRSNQTLIFKLTLLDWAEIPTDKQAYPVLPALPAK
jgi:FKBP-type peptidyl-prolyl cis-trans isomerase